MYRNDVPGNGRAFACSTSDDIADQIGLAGHPAELDEIIKNMWVDHTHGRISEGDMEALDEAARARREAIQTRRPRAPSAPQNALRSPTRPRRAIPRSPDRAASQQRRRDVGQERWLPPNIASQLTQGEVAVLSVMVREIVKRGVCDLPNDKIAGLAGVCPTLVKNTRRLAEGHGWVSVIHRPRPGQKSLTNLIYALSPELRAWIATRRKMIGGKSVPTAKTCNSDTSPRRPGMVPGHRQKRLGDGDLGYRPTEKGDAKVAATSK
jgi:hypothetical protein